MAVSLNDVVRFTQFFQQGSNEAAMVSYWTVSAIADAATDAALTEAFHTLMMGTNLLGSLIHVSGSATRTVMDNMTSPLEFAEWASVIPGLQTGDPAPPFVAVLIRQTRFSKATRNGYKRVPFVAEGVINGNTITIGVSPRTALQDWYGNQAPLVGTYSGETINITLTPLIVGRTLNGSGTYEPDLSRVNAVTGALVVRPTSQNSRKPRSA